MTTYAIKTKERGSIHLITETEVDEDLVPLKDGAVHHRVEIKKMFKPDFIIKKITEGNVNYLEFNMGIGKINKVKLMDAIESLQKRARRKDFEHFSYSSSSYHEGNKSLEYQFFVQRHYPDNLIIRWGATKVYSMRKDNFPMQEYSLSVKEFKEAIYALDYPYRFSADLAKELV